MRSYLPRFRPEQALTTAEMLFWVTPSGLAEARARASSGPGGHCADLPIGGSAKDAIALGDGRRSGANTRLPICCRGHETRRHRNTVWLTADLHYTDEHHVRSERALVRFEPLWEFVAGPLSAGTLGSRRTG